MSSEGVERGSEVVGKRRVLGWLVVTVAFNAAFDVAVGLPYDELGFAVFATTGLAAFFAFAWVRLDARERGLDLRAWGAAVAVLTKFALPIYFVVSRGWLEGLRANLLTLGLLGGLLGVYVAVVRVSVALLALI